MQIMDECRMDSVISSVHVVANCLLEWLAALKTPVIPSSFLEGLSYGKAMDCQFADTLLAMVSHPLHCITDTPFTICIITILNALVIGLID